MSRTCTRVRLHLRLTRPGLISAFELAPGNAADVAAAPDLLEDTSDWALGDRAYWGAPWHEEERKRGLHDERRDRGWRL